MIKTEDLTAPFKPSYRIDAPTAIGLVTDQPPRGNDALAAEKALGELIKRWLEVRVKGSFTTFELAGVLLAPAV